MTSLSILSNSDWKELYPAKEYITERAKPLILHFLLALGQPEATILNTIDTLQIRAKLVAHDAKCHRLTPLIIATMQGKEAIVDKLLTCDEVKKSINASDEFGWTALHHAILVSDRIYNNLLNADADESCKTNMLGTPRDIKALTSLDIKSRSLDRTLFEGKVLTPKEVEENFHLKYRDVTFFDQLKALWQQREEIQPGFNSVFINSVKRNLPLVSVRKQPEGFYGLEAAEDLVPGRVIGNYVGAYFEDPFKCCDFNTRLTPAYRAMTSYVLKNVDAKQMGSSVRFINCGFPNTTSLGYIEKGQDTTVIFAIEEVKKGEPLFMSYDADAVELTYGPQKLFNREVMHTFFRKGLKEHLEAVALFVRQQDTCSISNPALTDLPLLVQKFGLISKISFPLSNPIALLDLHFSGIVPAQDWKKALDTSENPVIQGWISQFGHAAVILVEVIKRLNKIEANIDKKGGTSAFHAWMLKHLESQTLMNLIKAMDWIEDEVMKGNLNFAETIEERLKSYDWTQDEEHLFSYKSRCKIFSRILGNSAYDKSKNVSLFYFLKKKEIEEQRRVRQESYSNFAGTEMDRMLCDIEKDIPSPNNPETYKQKLKEELADLYLDRNLAEAKIPSAQEFDAYKKKLNEEIAGLFAKKK